MTEHYVTLFDRVFLPQGLALHQSLLDHGGDFVLWVLCLDADCLNTLQRLNLPRLRLLNLAQLETQELLDVKPGRTRAEYCWTLTPWSLQWVLEADQSVQRVTYLDADVFFLKSPSPIFAEFESSGRSVLITEHGYAPQYDQTPMYGRYCVQFLTVVRGAGESVLHWWRDRCVEWCFARAENGLFADQKYLESFESLFPGSIHSLCADRRFQGPWNSLVYPFSDAVIYHFHELRILSGSLIIASGGGYELVSPSLRHLYTPYSRLLLDLHSKHRLPLLPQGHCLSLVRISSLRIKKKIYKNLGRNAKLPYLFVVNRRCPFGFIL